MITTIHDSIKEKLKAQLKRQEEERKRQEMAAANGRNYSNYGRKGGNNGNNDIPGGNYNFSLDDESVRNKINSEDDNTLLYAILAGIGVVGVAFLVKKSKNKNKKKKK